MYPRCALLLAGRVLHAQRAVSPPLVFAAARPFGSIAQWRVGASALPRAHAGAKRPNGDLGGTEDAFFVQPARSGDVFVGVADGVGTWHNSGVDPSAFPQRLMHHCQDAVAAVAPPPGGGASPAPSAVLLAGWTATLRERVVGSCTTAVVALVGGNSPEVRAAGLGDISVLVLGRANTRDSQSAARGGGGAGGWAIAARLSHRMRGFNYPFQLGFAPDAKAGAFDEPSEATELVFSSRSSSRPPSSGSDLVVVCSSDGLLDNVEEAELLEAVAAEFVSNEMPFAGRAAAGGGDGDGVSLPYGRVSPARASPSTQAVGSASMRRLAERLAAAALEHSTNKRRDGPFARAAKENDILWTAGGRPDDVTIVCAAISTIST